MRRDHVDVGLHRVSGAIRYVALLFLLDQCWTCVTQETNRNVSTPLPVTDVDQRSSKMTTLVSSVASYNHDVIGDTTTSASGVTRVSSTSFAGSTL